MNEALVPMIEKDTMMTAALKKSHTHSDQVYFDCNATTPTHEIAADAAMRTMKEGFGNPSSGHVTGIRAKHVLEETRSLAKKFIGASDADRVVFTSGATEGIHIAVFSALEKASALLAEGGSLTRRKILYGATEHKAVPQAILHWVRVLRLPFEVEAIPVLKNGEIDLDWLKPELRDCYLMATMAVNNETGVKAPLSEIQKLVASENPDCLWLVDSVQALGKMKLDLSRIDYATFSGHKLYAPKGIGFVFVRDVAPLRPFLVGGGQEAGIRSGTENLPGVAALGAVLEDLNAGKKSKINLLAECDLNFCREKIASALKRSFPAVIFNAPFSNSIATTLNFSVPGFTSKEIMDVLDAAGVRVSAGSACSTGKASSSYVLDAMGCEPWSSFSAIRLSFGPNTSSAEIEHGIEGLERAATALQSSCVFPGISNGFPNDRSQGVVQFRSGSSNTWVLTDVPSKTCLIIDPCHETADRVAQFVCCQGLIAVGILDTHLHADHASAEPELVRLLEGSLHSRVVLGGEKTPFGKGYLLNIPTPGHTSESVSYVFVENEKVRFAFTGDLILTGSLGRTNFPTSSALSLIESLQTLDRILPDTCCLCPSHDYVQSFATTWGAEKQTNPLLMEVLAATSTSAQEAFALRKKQIDLALNETDARGEILCGVSKGLAADLSPRIAPGNLNGFARAQEVPLRVLDVREPWEWEAFQDWPLLGFPNAPENVPLSRFVNLVSELLESIDLCPPVVLICRSGTRSLAMAQSLRRLGYRNAWSLDGGVAFGIPSLLNTSETPPEYSI